MDKRKKTLREEWERIMKEAGIVNEELYLVFLAGASYATSRMLEEDYKDFMADLMGESVYASVEFTEEAEKLF